MARPPRIKTFDYIGCHRYFLTVCTHNRRPAFTEHGEIGAVMDAFYRVATDHDIAFMAHCAMPDHLHLLATGQSETADLRRCIKLAKQVTGWKYKQAAGVLLWQDGFHDHVLREEDDTLGVVKYIINNPLRAGLVQSPLDYPFWGSQAYTREALIDLLQGQAEWRPPWSRQV